MGYDLKFNNEKYSVETVTMEGKTVTYRAFEGIVYVKNPSFADHQKLSIFVPECYYKGDSIGKYNFFALLRGYVVVSPAVRGRGLLNEQGEFVGTAPAVMVDLKAAVRYLRHNKERIPGNTERIISNGTSAGGAISALLGASGNHQDYEVYLEEAGAAKERDDIWGASCYCPITNLDHADMAYEWEFHGLDDYHRMKFEMCEDGTVNMTPVDGGMNELQQKLSVMEKEMFPEYLNSLELRDEDDNLLQLDQEGSGTFKDYMKRYVLESITAEIKKGTDLSEYQWIEWQAGKPVRINFDEYVRYRTRMKQTPAFDDVECRTPENELFGRDKVQYRHFTEFSFGYSSVNGQLAEPEQVKRMNPMNYIVDAKADTAKHYRIRHGAIDRDTSLAVSAMLTQSLRNHGATVDYHLPWDVAHDGDYDLEDLFTWMDKIVADT